MSSTVHMKEGPKIKVDIYQEVDVSKTPAVSTEKVWLLASWAPNGTDVSLDISFNMTAAEAKRLAYALLRQALAIEPASIRDHVLSIRKDLDKPDKPRDNVIQIGP